jgi:hypothetical protein
MWASRRKGLIAALRASRFPEQATLEEEKDVAPWAIIIEGALHYPHKVTHSSVPCPPRQNVIEEKSQVDQGKMVHESEWLRSAKTG